MKTAKDASLEKILTDLQCEKIDLQNKEWYMYFKAKGYYKEEKK